MQQSITPLQMSRLYCRHGSAVFVGVLLPIVWSLPRRLLCLGIEVVVNTGLLMEMPARPFFEHFSLVLGKTVEVITCCTLEQYQRYMGSV